MTFPRPISQGTALGDLLRNLVQPTSPPNAGDVLTWNATAGRYEPAAPLPHLLLWPAPGAGAQLADTDLHEYPIVLNDAAFSVGAWTVNSNDDLVLPVAGWYECTVTALLGVTADTGSRIAVALNSATSQEEIGPVVVSVPADPSLSLNYVMAQEYLHAAAGRSLGKVQVTQFLSAAAAAALPVTLYVQLRVFARDA